MAIDPNLLISEAILQDYLVDKTTGQALAAGVVTFYEDDSRTTLKNWFYQTGSPNNYQWIPGPNPMTLTAVGTFSDANGNDVIPFFYPYDENNKNDIEPYFVRVENSNGQLQFTRENFPFLPQQTQPGSLVPSLTNYIINGEFWRNFGSANLPTTLSPSLPFNSYQTKINGFNFVATTLAPSSHDGFSMPDMIVLKDQVGATDTISFVKFPQGDSPVLENDLTPEFYLDWNCTAHQAGQTLKCLQFPFQLHIETLENTKNVTVAFHANNLGTGPLNQIVVQILQFTGSSTSSTNSSFIVEQSFDIDNGWHKYVTAPFALPNADNLVLSGTGDDALYIQFAFPPTQEFHIQFAKPQFYLSASIPTNDWSTYDQIDSIVNTPRTGDIRTGLNSFEPFGWVPMNDGTIGNTGSNATTRANVDTWPLYNLLWNLFSSSILPVNQKPVRIYLPFTLSPPPPPLVAVQPYSANLTAFGATAFDDWTANKSLSLTKMLGRSLYGIAPQFPITFTATVAAANGFTFTSGALNNVYDGSPILFTSAPGANAPFPNITYYIKFNSSTTFSIYWDSLLTQIVTGTFDTETVTGQVPDQVLGQFAGWNFGDTGTSSPHFQDTTGYPGKVAAGTAAVGVRNPFIYMNFFMKL